MSGEDELETIELGVSSAKVASLVAFAQVSSTLISAFMLIALARLLQPADYGIYTLAYSVSIFFSAFGLAGIGHFLNKHIPVWLARRRRSELANYLGVAFLTLVAICALEALAGAAFGGLIANTVFHNSAYIPIIYLALASILFVYPMYLAYNVLIGFKDGMGSAATYSIGNLGIAAASILLVILGYGVSGAIVGIIVGSALGTAIGIAFITKHSRIGFSDGAFPGRAKSMLAFSMPIAIATMIPVLMNNLSMIVLGVFSTSALVGSFGIAYRIGTIVIAATYFVAAVLVQMFSSALESKRAKSKIDRFYNYSVYFGVMLTAPVAAYLVALARAFVTSLFPLYKSSLLYTPALTISLLVGIVGLYASSLAISFGKVQKILKYAVVTGMVQLLLLLLLVPLVHAYGIILGVYLGGSLVGNYLYVQYMKREFGIRTEMSKVYRMILANAALALLLFPINFLPASETAQLAVGIVAVVVLYPILLGVTGSVGRNEIRLMRELGGRTPALSFFIPPITSYISFFIR